MWKILIFFVIIAVFFTLWYGYYNPYIPISNNSVIKIKKESTCKNTQNIVIKKNLANCQVTKTLKGNLPYIQKAINKFREAGWSCQWSIVMAGSLIRESGMDSRTIGDNWKSIWLAQWNNTRRKNLATHCKNIKDFRCQLDFLVKEVEGGNLYSYTKKIMHKNNATNAELRKAIHKYKKYGIIGKRFIYSRYLFHYLK